MTSEQIYSELSDIFSEIFFRDDIVLRHDLTADEVEGWTSFKQVEILDYTVEKSTHFLALAIWLMRLARKRSNRISGWHYSQFGA
jgi:hypothetical protein